MDNPLPDSSESFTFMKFEADPESFYAYVTVNKFRYSIDIAIYNGFIVMIFDGMEDKIQKTVANQLFATLIGHYHVNVTHDSDNGLTPVKAKDSREAASLIVSQILSISEDFIFLTKETESVETLKGVYLTSLGMVEYGKAFVNVYVGELGQLVDECRERLESMSRFIDAIYGTVRDSIQDNLAHRSQIMSESTQSLSRGTVTLSMAVLGLTWFSSVISLASLSMDYQGLEIPSIWVVTAVATIPPIIILIGHGFARYFNN